MDWYRSELRRVLAKLQPSAILSGMALGVDQEAAGCAIELSVPFVAVVPFPSQDAGWPAPARVRYRKLLEAAAEVVMVSTEAPTGHADATEKLRKRNDALVERAEIVVACWSGTASGGTWYTIKAARRAGRPLVLIRPGQKTILQDNHANRQGGLRRSLWLRDRPEVAPATALGLPQQ